MKAPPPSLTVTTPNGQPPDLAGADLFATAWEATMGKTTRWIAALAVVAGTTAGVTAAHAAHASTPRLLETFKFDGTFVQYDRGGDWSGRFYATKCTLTSADDAHPLTCDVAGAGVGLEDGLDPPYQFLGALHVTSADGQIAFSFLQNGTVNPAQLSGHGTARDLGRSSQPVVAHGQVTDFRETSTGGTFKGTWNVYAAGADS
jgi:hypothetical protein